MKDFDKWNEEKKILDEDDFSGFVHEREIWWCSLGVNVGHEEDGKNEQFERPALILKKWSNKTVIILPMPTKTKKNKYHFAFQHEGIEFAVILSQVRIISTNRLTRKIRKINRHLFGDIQRAFVGLITNEPLPKQGSPEPFGHL